MITSLPLFLIKFDCSITCMFDCTRSHIHTLSTPTSIQQQTNCHPVIHTSHWDSPGHSNYHKPIAPGKHLQVALSTYNTALSTPERMTIRLVDYKQGLGIPTEFLVWPQARKWIQNDSRQCSTLWVLKGRTNWDFFCKDMWSCAFVLVADSQSARTGQSKINPPKGISLP